MIDAPKVRKMWVSLEKKVRESWIWGDFRMLIQMCEDLAPENQGMVVYIILINASLHWWRIGTNVDGMFCESQYIQTI